MLWFLAFHVIFVVTWFAGLFYLPRLFVYAAMHPEPEHQHVFNVMQRKLLGITHIGGALAVGFGIAVILTAPDAYLAIGWLHAKLALVLLLIVYHFWCARLVAEFARLVSLVQRGAGAAAGRDRAAGDPQAILRPAIHCLFVDKQAEPARTETTGLIR